MDFAESIAIEMRQLLTQAVEEEGVVHPCGER